MRPISECKFARHRSQGMKGGYSRALGVTTELPI